MSGVSLRWRLLVGAALSTALALAIAGFGLVLLFERHVARRLDAELGAYLNGLTAQLTVAGGGLARPFRPLADPRFDQPLSGLYWQIEDADGTLVRSRSLWDAAIVLPADVIVEGSVHRHELAGPAASRVVVLERRVIVGAGAAGRAIRFAVAADARVLIEARAAFAGELAATLALLAAVLIAGAWVQLSFGLRPLEAVRRGVSAIRSGTAQRLSGAFPAEVCPLVEEVNGLLAAQEQAIARARDRAADLAHGLKTPLTALAGDVQRLRARGEGEIAAEIETAAEMMRRHVERELVRARTRGRQPGAALPATALAPLVQRLIETLRRTPKGEPLAWRVEIAPSLCVAIDRDDLSEILGNLMENAVDHARARVAVAAERDAAAVVVAVEDDGPGVAPSQRHAIVARGRRLDEHGTGAGLGLAIVQDVLDAYGGTLSLQGGALGGLKVALRLPAGR